MGDGGVSTCEDEEEVDFDDYSTRVKVPLVIVSLCAQRRERPEHGQHRGRPRQASDAKRSTDDGFRHNLTQSGPRRFLAHDLGRLGSPRKRKVGRLDTHTRGVARTHRAPFPPPIAESNSAKSQNRKEARVHVSLPSSVAEGTQEGRPRRVPRISAVRGRDGGRTQSGGVTGMIAPELGPNEPSCQMMLSQTR